MQAAGHGCGPRTGRMACPLPCEAPLRNPMRDPSLQRVTRRGVMCATHERPIPHPRPSGAAAINNRTGLEMTTRSCCVAGCFRPPAAIDWREPTDTAFALTADAESTRAPGCLLQVRPSLGWHHPGFGQGVFARPELVTTRRFCLKFNDRFARQLFEKSMMNQVLAISNPGCSRAQPSCLGGVGCLPRTR